MSAAAVGRSRHSTRALRGRIIGVAVLAVVLRKYFPLKDIFLPWGAPDFVDLVANRGQGYAAVDTKEDSLRFHHGRTKRIFGRGSNAHLIHGPETVAIRPSNNENNPTLYLLTADGLMLSMEDVQPMESTEDKKAENITDYTADIQRLRDLGNGRPLGSAFTRDGRTLYIADAVLGLTRIADIDNPQSKVEIMASSVELEDGTWSKLKYVDDVCVGPQSGNVYFTDASDVQPESIGRNTPDTMYSYKVDLVRGKKTGRVLEYNPSTDKLRILAENIHFANGITVNKDERYLVVSETSVPRMIKIHLKGEKTGQVETLVDSHDMMGYPDGVDCNHETGKCYASLPSSIVPVHKLLVLAPSWLEWGLRLLLLLLPRQISPPPEQFGGILEMDPDTKHFRYVLDPTGKDIAMVTGVTVHKDNLYLGSLHNSYIGVYSLVEPKKE